MEMFAITSEVQRSFPRDEEVECILADKSSAVKLITSFDERTMYDYFDRVDEILDAISSSSIISSDTEDSDDTYNEEEGEDEDEDGQYDHEEESVWNDISISRINTKASWALALSVIATVTCLVRVRYSTLFPENI
jgi:hypothetical protein